MQFRFFTLVVLVISFFLSQTAHAQITIEKSDIEANIGKTFVMESFDASPGQETALLLALVGAVNAVWDFSALTFSSTGTWVLNFVELPASLLGSDDPRVADANFAIQTYPLGGDPGQNQNVQYFQLTDSDLLSFGYSGLNMGSELEQFYDSGLRHHNIPMVLAGGAWTGTTTFSDGATSYTVGTVAFVDAWGTLTLPGTAPMEVLRVNEVRTIIDSTPGSLAVQRESYKFFSKMGEVASYSVTDYSTGFQITQFSYSTLEESGTGTSAEEADKAIPSDIVLHSNYPNPFNPTTRISFDLPRDGHVTLAIYNMIGQEVARPVDRPMSASRHELTWNASNFPTGVYVYTLRAGAFIESRTMVLIK